jgi:hypothetical protein
VDQNKQCKASKAYFAAWEHHGTSNALNRLAKLHPCGHGNQATNIAKRLYRMSKCEYMESVLPPRYIYFALTRRFLDLYVKMVKMIGKEGCDVIVSCRGQKKANTMVCTGQFRRADQEELFINSDS